MPLWTHKMLSTVRVANRVTTVVVSGYFNPLHGGHLDLLEAASLAGDKLVVIVNNDVQQIIKKGRIILDQYNRLRLVRSLYLVDSAILSIDTDKTVCKTLAYVASRYKNDHIVFANGGDRTSDNIPEMSVCKENGIEVLFGVGGEKSDSSSRIIDFMKAS